MYVSCPRPGQTDRNRPQIERRSLLLAPQTVRDRTDEAYIGPPAGSPALDASVAPLSGTTTKPSAHKCVAPLRVGRGGSQHILCRKCDVLIIDGSLSRIYAVCDISSRYFGGQMILD